MTTYKYSVGDDGSNKFIEVEKVGRFGLNQGDDPAEKAKDLIVSILNEDRDGIDVEEVDDVSGSGVITSGETANK